MSWRICWTFLEVAYGFFVWDVFPEEYFLLKKKSSESLQELLDSSFLVSTGHECGNFLPSWHKFDNYVAYVFSFVEVMVVVGSRMKPV